MFLHGHLGLCAMYVGNGKGHSFKFLRPQCSLATPCCLFNIVSSFPQVAEFVDERPEDIKQMEAFRSSAKWKLLGSEF